MGIRTWAMRPCLVGQLHHWLCESGFPRETELKPYDFVFLKCLWVGNLTTEVTLKSLRRWSKWEEIRII